LTCSINAPAFPDIRAFDVCPTHDDEFDFHPPVRIDIRRIRWQASNVTRFLKQVDSSPEVSLGDSSCSHSSAFMSEVSIDKSDLKLKAPRTQVIPNRKSSTKRIFEQTKKDKE
jgi:hypothetical protein